MMQILPQTPLKSIDFPITERKPTDSQIPDRQLIYTSYISRPILEQLMYFASIALSLENMSLYRNIIDGEF